MDTVKFVKRRESIFDVITTMRRMSFRGGTKTGSVSSPDDENPPGSEDVVCSGYLRKLKTGKRKFFVLHSGSDGSQARLEYYDNDKKWRSIAEPKRSINIRSCFDINRKHDPKGRIVLALYTPRDCFALQCSSQEEQDQWLSALLRLQQDGHLPDTTPRPNFDHIWEVNIKQKSLGSKRNIQGDHRLCLTSKSLCLVPLEKDRTHSTNSLTEENQDPPVLEFALNSIRRCGHTDFFFYMELGRSSVTGSGELWMQTDDTVIAQNMHEVILSAMKSFTLNEDAPRPRSSSTSENSKPVSIPPRAILTTNSLLSSHGASPLNGMSLVGISPRDRCDSLPSRSRQSSESFDHAVPTRCNTMDCTHVGQPHAFHWSAPGGVSPVGQLHNNHSSLESCAEEGTSPHSNPAPRSHLHINITHPLDSQPIAEEQESSDYLAMNSPGQPDTGSLIPSPVTLTDGGPSSLSSQCGPSYLPHQHSSTSSNEYMKMSPTHDGSHHSTSGPITSTGSNNNNNTDSSYMSMSPVGNSMASSNANGTLSNGYVPMMISSANKSHTESSPLSPPGYMEMAPLSSSLPKSVGGFTGSWASSIHSLHEASPTFDLNLEGFHLEKVKSFIAPSDDENSIRTGRSYSVGKRPTTERLTNERVRAYSVGSQAYPAALAAKKRQQLQQQQQEGFGTPKSERGRSNSYSKKSSSTTTLGGGSRHSEEFMEINYDENWHRATSAAAAASSPLTLPPPISTANLTNTINNNDSDYLPMTRVNYKDSDPMKLFPVKEVEVASSNNKESEYFEHSFFSSPRNTNSKETKAIPSEYMDITCGPASPPQSVPQSQSARPSPSDGDGEYVSLDMSRPWNSRNSSNPITGGPEPKKSKSEIQSPDVPMTTQHNYENLSFGANGATVENVSSQEPMETDIKTPLTPTTLTPLATPTSSIDGGRHELNYASLDLPPPTDETPVNRTIPPAMDSAGGLAIPGPTGVSYSEVDFRKSEGLRGSMLREGGRV